MKTTIDPDTLTALLAAFIETPSRLAALERAVADLTAQVVAVHATMPPLFVSVPEAATRFKVSIPTMRRLGWASDFRAGRTKREDTSPRGNVSSRRCLLYFAMPCLALLEFHGNVRCPAASKANPTAFAVCDRLRDLAF